MPRSYRIVAPNSVYHIMSRSLTEFPLFRDDQDKIKFLTLIKKYQMQYNFSVYAYCLMTTHFHLIISDPTTDLSSFMKNINQCYAQYYNKKYNRNGSVFRDRFKSIIVDNDNYLLTLSAYIHKNPSSIKKYKNCIEKYKFSSLSVYLGLNKDPFNILNESYVMSIFSKNIKKARENYIQFVYGCNEHSLMKAIEFQDSNSEYRSEKTTILKSYTPEDILNFITSYTKLRKWQILMKNKHNSSSNKALLIFLLRCLGHLTQKEICNFIGNITQSSVSQLCSLGTKLVLENNNYKNIVEDFLQFTST
ncbi:transposase [Haloimpatiens lingqiaonensis]|uniref:transposase n=1 Tax=Haloimpatiens lingqiaonensis TaxID=1380675 RepID=UPI0010FE6490|nr:transposase [Haloimpatiens lingqiaonensis]